MASAFPNSSIPECDYTNNIATRTFVCLDSDTDGVVDFMDLDDDKILAGNLLFNDSPSLPISNTKIVAKDKYGNIIMDRPYPPHLTRLLGEFYEVGK